MVQRVGSLKKAGKTVKVRAKSTPKPVSSKMTLEQAKSRYSSYQEVKDKDGNVIKLVAPDEVYTSFYDKRKTGREPSEVEEKKAKYSPHEIFFDNIGQATKEVKRDVFRSYDYRKDKDGKKRTERRYDVYDKEVRLYKDGQLDREQYYDVDTAEEQRRAGRDIEVQKAYLQRDIDYDSGAPVKATKYEFNPYKKKEYDDGWKRTYKAEAKEDIDYLEGLRRLYSPSQEKTSQVGGTFGEKIEVKRAREAQQKADRAQAYKERSEALKELGSFRGPVGSAVKDASGKVTYGTGPYIVKQDDIRWTGEFERAEQKIAAGETDVDFFGGPIEEKTFDDRVVLFSGIGTKDGEKFLKSSILEPSVRPKWEPSPTGEVDLSAFESSVPVEAFDDLLNPPPEKEEPTIPTVSVPAAVGFSSPSTMLATGIGTIASKSGVLVAGAEKLKDWAGWLKGKTTDTVEAFQFPYELGVLNKGKLQSSMREIEGEIAVIDAKDALAQKKPEALSETSELQVELERYIANPDIFTDDQKKSLFGRLGVDDKNVEFIPVSSFSQEAKGVVPRVYNVDGKEIEFYIQKDTSELLTDMEERWYDRPGDRGKEAARVSKTGRVLIGDLPEEIDETIAAYNERVSEIDSKVGTVLPIEIVELRAEKFNTLKGERDLLDAQLSDTVSLFNQKVERFEAGEGDVSRADLVVLESDIKKDIERLKALDTDTRIAFSELQDLNYRLEQDAETIKDIERLDAESKELLEEIKVKGGDVSNVKVLATESLDKISQADKMTRLSRGFEETYADDAWYSPERFAAKASLTGLGILKTAGSAIVKPARMFKEDYKEKSFGEKILTGLDPTVGVRYLGKAIYDPSEEKGYRFDPEVATGAAILAATAYSGALAPAGKGVVGATRYFSGIPITATAADTTIESTKSFAARKLLEDEKKFYLRRGEFREALRAGFESEKESIKPDFFNLPERTLYNIPALPLALDKATPKYEDAFAQGVREYYESLGYGGEELEDAVSGAKKLRKASHRGEGFAVLMANVAAEVAGGRLVSKAFKSVRVRDISPLSGAIKAGAATGAAGIYEGAGVEMASQTSRAEMFDPSRVGRAAGWGGYSAAAIGAILGGTGVAAAKAPPGGSSTAGLTGTATKFGVYVGDVYEGLGDITESLLSKAFGKTSKLFKGATVLTFSSPATMTPSMTQEFAFSEEFGTVPDSVWSASESPRAINVRTSAKDITAEFTGISEPSVSIPSERAPLKPGTMIDVPSDPNTFSQTLTNVPPQVVTPPKVIPRNTSTDPSPPPMVPTQSFTSVFPRTTTQTVVPTGLGWPGLGLPKGRGGYGFGGAGINSWLVNNPIRDFYSEWQAGRRARKSNMLGVRMPKKGKINNSKKSNNWMRGMLS